MKTFKRIASLIIAIAMMAAMVVMPVSAAEEVFRLWDFDDNALPGDVVPTSAVTKSVSGGILYTEAARGQTRE